MTRNFLETLSQKNRRIIVKTKGFVIISLVLAVLLAACATAAAPAAAPSPAADPDALEETVFDSIYDKYEDRLILTGSEKYVVQSGDTLSQITRNQYGPANGLYFPLIMLASSDIVSDPDLIEPGMELTVPDLQRNLDNINARQALKEFLQEIAGVYERKGAYDTTRRGLLELSSSL
jgi:hypothetical protein